MAPLRRDMLVLLAGHPDALDGVGVRGRADEDVFVVLRGWLNDILSGQVSRFSCVGVEDCRAQDWNRLALESSFLQLAADESPHPLESDFRNCRSPESRTAAPTRQE